MTGSERHAPHSRSAVRQRQPPEVRRRMIIEAARTLIGSQGLSATTLRDVARVSDVALGTVTYHFAGIDEVLAEVIAEEMVSFSAPITDAARRAPTGAAGLRTIADGLLASGERAAQHWRLWLDFWSLAARMPRYATWQSEIYRNLHELVGELLERGRADGSLATTAADRSAVEYVALLDGLVVQCYLPHPRLRPAQARRILQSSVGL